MYELSRTRVHYHYTCEIFQRAAVKHASHARAVKRAFLVTYVNPLTFVARSESLYR